MINFTSEKNSEIVWDAENNTPLCRFKDGKLSVSDKRIISILKKMGYKYKEPTKKVVDSQEPINVK